MNRPKLVMFAILFGILIGLAPVIFSDTHQENVENPKDDTEYQYEEFIIPISTQCSEEIESFVTPSPEYVSYQRIEPVDNSGFFYLLNQYRSLPQYTNELKEDLQIGNYWLITYELRDMVEKSEPLLTELKNCRVSSGLWKPREIMLEGLYSYNTGAKDLLAGIQKHAEGDKITELELIHQGIGKMESSLVYAIKTDMEVKKSRY